MSYTALYRKWRPRVFEEVVGQEAIVSTLRNQFRTETIGHAYLFSGTRGTGKTTSAKLFSRLINCLNPVDANPCNTCEICKGILDESLMDVVEIDAASNNGVDDIRELRENVKYPPSKAKYKVYIIDEVHMLSTGAFNALLKTLEEPPNYVVFILATTEPHKLPATILSRCQRFDFKRVGASDLSFRLKYITEAQGYLIEDEALDIIIRKSDGAVRDALSMLDQCFSYGENNITELVVSEALGLVNREVIKLLVQLMIEEKIVDVFETVQQMIANGKNLNQFVKDFIEYYRDLMIVAAAGSEEKLTKTGMSIDVLAEQAKKLGMSRVWQGLQSLIELDNAMKWSANTRVLLEMALVKMTQTKGEGVAATDSGVLERLAHLEAIVKGMSSNSQVSNRVSEVIQPRPTTSKVPDVPTKRTEPVVTTKPVPAVIQTESMADDLADGDNTLVDSNIVKDKWSEILQYLKKRKVSLYAFLVEGSLISVTGKVVNIGFKEGFGFHLNAISQDSNRQEVEKAVKAVTGYHVRLNFDYTEAFNDSSGIVVESSSEEAVKSFLGDQSNKLEVLD